MKRGTGSNVFVIGDVHVVEFWSPRA